MIFLDGVDQDVAYDSIGDGHQTGMACVLTNTEILPGTLFCEGSCDAGQRAIRRLGRRPVRRPVPG